MLSTSQDDIYALGEVVKVTIDSAEYGDPAVVTNFTGDPKTAQILKAAAGKKVTLRGTYAPKGSTVTISVFDPAFNLVSANFAGNDGKWSVEIPANKSFAGSTYTIDAKCVFEPNSDTDAAKLTISNTD